MTEEALQLWTVYDRPSDFPAAFVARRHDVYRDGSRPTRYFLMALDLEDLRNTLEAMGLALVCRRDPEDDPCIVETWA